MVRAFNRSSSGYPRVNALEFAPMGTPDRGNWNTEITESHEVATEHQTPNPGSLVSLPPQHLR